MKFIKCAVAILLIAQYSAAQETAFLKGQFVEFVVNKDGVFYASGNIPTGFHNTQEDFSLVADPDQNGWEVGSPAFYGDYFAPGAPMEGFVVQVDEKVFRNSAVISKAKAKQAFESKAFQKSIEGLNHRVQYEGEIKQLVNLKQKITFVENDTKIKFEITVKNLDSKPHQFYYNRFADSDVNKNIDGSYRTANHAKYSKQSNKVSMVKGSASSQNGYFSMFTLSENSNSSTDLTWFAKPRDLYNQVNNGNEKNEDASINLTFDLGKIEPSGEKTFTFYYLLTKNQEGVLCGGDCDGIDSSNDNIQFIIQDDKIHDVDIASIVPDNNQSGGVYINPYTWTQNGKLNTKRVLLKFDLSEIPENAEIDSVFLDLYFSNYLNNQFPYSNGHSPRNELQLSKIIENWEVNEVTWNNKPGISQEHSITIPAATNSLQNYEGINITDLVNSMRMYGNYGIEIKHSVEEIYKITMFASSRDSDPSKRPKIRIYAH